MDYKWWSYKYVHVSIISNSIKDIILIYIFYIS